MNRRVIVKIFFIAGFLILGQAGLVGADVYINKLVVNGTEKPKETPINFALPGDLTSADILDTNGLDLDYNVNDANYYLHGNVTLQPKESKTFRIRVKDVWKLDQSQIDAIKKAIDEGYEQIGKQKNAEQGQLLKDYLIQKLDFLQEKSAKADGVEKRIDAYRTYSKELKRIENSALNVDYWRSDPSEVKQDKIVRFSVEVENPSDKVRPYKNKQYLPAEVKPEDLVEFEGFEVRYDQEKKQSFLFKEDELQPNEKKKFTIGLRDIWFIPQKDVDYLHTRTNSAYESLKDSKYGASAKILFDNINGFLKTIEDSQLQKKNNIKEHISAFRNNQVIYENARVAVETLEKLLSLYREDLEKSKVQNVLRKVKSLQGISGISQAIFDKAKVSESDSWKFIFWILIFVGALTLVSFVVWIIRSKEKVLSTSSETSAAANQEAKAGTQAKK